MTAAMPLIIKATEAVPLTFSQGDILSAEVLNTIFTRLNKATNQVTQSDLVGVWSCQETRDRCFGEFGWVNDVSGLFCTRTQTYTFTDAGNGTLTFSTDKGFPVRSAATAGQEGNVPTNSVTAVIPSQTNLLRFIHQSGIGGNILVKRAGTDSLQLNEVAQPNSALCTKQNQPATPPTTLSATATGTFVALTWVDQSTDETGFKVQAKTEVAGTWTTLETTTAGVQAITVVGNVGNNWYRVLATNANGDSITSNEVLVEIE
jgi:hypothetical protein